VTLCLVKESGVNGTSGVSAAASGRAIPADDQSVLADSRLDPERFSVLFDRYFGQIHRYVAARLGSAAADDLAAETFLVAFGKRGTFDPARGQVRPWLFGIATNLVARHHRDEARRYAALRRVPALRQAAPDGGHEDRVCAKVSAQSLSEPLAAALAGLADGDRDVLLLVAVGELSYQEVAAALGIAAGTVASRLSRARAKIRQALGAGSGAEDSPWMS
jgi:RNA polymerase sigma factor (sigma-70 family)